MTQISSAAFSTSWPLTFARGRNGDVYAVNGSQRGLRWDTVTASVEQLGITAPAAPTVTSSASSPKFDVRGIQVLDPGQGYRARPTPSFTGVGTTNPIIACDLASGRVNNSDPRRYGVGFATPPTCTLPPPDGPGAGSGATLSVTYTSIPGTEIDGSAYTYYTVTGVSVSSGGSGYVGSPRVLFGDDIVGGAVAEAVVDTSGQIASVRLLNGGTFRSIPTATIIPDPSFENRTAVALADAAPGIQGKYWCAIRYIDDTSAAKAGPIPSNISELTAVEVANPAGSFSWSWSNSGQEARVDKIELWRTTADQVLVLYKVATVSKSTTSYTDTLSDVQLSDPTRNGFASLPITLPNGQPNARRFTPPPQNKRVITVFQDRAWYAVDVPGRTYAGGSDAAAAEPNALYFSEADEPESVPETNQLVIQENVKGQDRITALMPFGGGMVVFQERHCYRLSFVSQPLIDANITLIGQRGCLNQRCWDTYDNVAYVVDSSGMYALDGSNAVPLSDSVETFWSNNVIHFASSKWFFVRVDPTTRIVRFFHSVTAGFPDRALCFHPLTKAWWVEIYAQRFAAMECLASGGRQQLVAGGEGGGLYRFDYGDQDVTSGGGAAGIACYLRTGNLSFAPQEKDRNIRILYQPTAADCNLTLAIHYNNSATPRQAAVATDRGVGFTTAQNGAATLNMKLARSALGDSTGYAVCHYSGRVDDRSSGGDRHAAIALSITRPAGDSAVLYGAGIAGVAQ